MDELQGSQEVQVHQGRAVGGAILKLNMCTVVSICRALVRNTKTSSSRVCAASHNLSTISVHGINTTDPALLGLSYLQANSICETEIFGTGTVLNILSHYTC